MIDHTSIALCQVGVERLAQEAKWGEQNHPNGTGGPEARSLTGIMRRNCDNAFKAGIGTWRHILLEEVYEALGESDHMLLREELIQVAAVAVAWVEALDRTAAAAEAEAVEAA